MRGGREGNRGRGVRGGGVRVERGSESKEGVGSEGNEGCKEKESSTTKSIPECIT